MVSKDRTQFSLLSKNNFHVCNNNQLQFCNPESAFYQTNVNKLCVLALFMKNREDIKELCKQTVILNERLPKAEYLTAGIWIITTNKQLVFTVSCH